MKQLIISGGTPLRGSVSVAGAKNAINKQLVASLLTDEPCTFHNVPQNTETQSVLSMIESLGAEHEWLSDSSLRVQTLKITSHEISTEYSGYNRIPILFLGPLLHRVGQVSVPLVGGCNIGPRPVDFHLAGLRRMEAHITESSSGVSAKSSKLKGCDIDLPFPSVGATENLLFAACLAEGVTVIRNAAIEPEIIDTILVLQKMGAHIFVDVDRRIVIEGVARLSGTEHAVVPDRMEVAAFAAAAVATGGEVLVTNGGQEHLITWINTLRRMGARVQITQEGILFARDNNKLEAVHVETDVHPGFMTDWQQPLLVVLTQAEGASVIHETMYESRFGFVDTLNDMGANIKLSTSCLGHKVCRYTDKNYFHSAVVVGPTPLRAATYEIPDLRAGFAYVIAALTASGESTITGLSHLDRGHPNLVARLNAIGASAKIVET